MDGMSKKELFSWKRSVEDQTVCRGTKRKMEAKFLLPGETLAANTAVICFLVISQKLRVKRVFLNLACRRFVFISFFGRYGEIDHPGKFFGKRSCFNAYGILYVFFFKFNSKRLGCFLAETNVAFILPSLFLCPICEKNRIVTKVAILGNFEASSTLFPRSCPFLWSWCFYTPLKLVGTVFRGCCVHISLTAIFTFLFDLSGETSLRSLLSRVALGVEMSEVFSA